MMQRRKFMQQLAASGLAFSVPFSAGATELDDGTNALLVCVHAVGGWDPRLLCDPKLDVVNNRVCPQIATVGSLSYAPVAMTANTTGLPANLARQLMEPAAFFERHGRRLTCINGLDMQTTDHHAATRALWTGRAEPGHPVLGALTAAAQGGAFVGPMHLPTAGLTPPIRIRAEGGRAVPFAEHDDPDALLSAFDTQPSITVPAVSAPPTASGELADLSRFMRQAELVIAAYEAGVVRAAQLQLGGFDTHGSHDREQVRQLGKLLRGVDHLLDYAADRGLVDQVTVVVMSELGRSPTYDGPQRFAGKDDHAVTSAMVLGRGVAGNRAIGATDADQRSLGHAGAALTPARLHVALRQLTGVQTSAVAADFPLPSAPALIL